MVALTVVVNSGAVVIVIVLAVSHPPVVLATVSISTAGPLNTCPNIVAGYLHTVALTVVVNSGAVVIVIVLAVSHPPVVLATVSINVPGPLNTCLLYTSDAADE